MPIRALCTICSDFFDHSRDVAAIHCGHTFHLQCLIQWFETAPSRTCPQCRIQVGKKSIINKLFFDLAQEEEIVLDAEFLKLGNAEKKHVEELGKHLATTSYGIVGLEGCGTQSQFGAQREVDCEAGQKLDKEEQLLSRVFGHSCPWSHDDYDAFLQFTANITLQNELDNTRAQLAQKEKEKRDSQAIIDMLRDTLEERNATVESLQQSLNQTEMLCSTLKKQLKYWEQHHNETKQAQEEARQLRSKMKTMERIELLLQSQRPQVEEMIRDMGVGQSAVEQLAVYCVSLKKEYENLKEARKASGELAEKLRKDLFSSKSKLQTVYSELDQAKLELKSSQKDLQSAEKEISSLKKKLTMLQETLNLPPVDNETVNRLVFESPAPVEMLNLKLRRPAFSDDIDLNETFYVDTPPARPSSSQHGLAKKFCLEKALSPVRDIPKKMPKVPKQDCQLTLGGQCCVGELDEELAGAFPVFIRNAILNHRQPTKTRTESSHSTDAIRTGFDGLGGRTKFIQPSDSTVIRPLPVKTKTKAKKAVMKTVPPSSQTKLDTFLR